MNNDPATLAMALAHQQKISKRLLMACAAMSCAFILLFLFSFTRPADATAVIRTKGIIIVDENGRERILIGAPTPFSKDRFRNDTARVKALWGGRYPDANQYMTYYKTYHKDPVGMIILDGNGQDRLAIGDSVPDPSVGKRIGPQTGLIISDENGNERTGYGLLNVKGRHRVVLGLDTDHGTEGAALTVVDDGTSGLTIFGDNGKRFFAGSAPAGHYMTGLKDPFLGMIIRDKNKIQYSVNGMINSDTLAQNR